jgi:hypothetical protein
MYQLVNVFIMYTIKIYFYLCKNSEFNVSYLAGLDLVYGIAWCAATSFFRAFSPIQIGLGQKAEPQRKPGIPPSAQARAHGSSLAYFSVQSGQIADVRLFLYSLLILTRPSFRGSLVT